MRIAIAVLLSLVAVFLWWAGGRERELARARQALMTLQPDEAVRRLAAIADAGLPDRLFGALWGGAGELEASRAAARYWAAPTPSERPPDPPGARTTGRPDGSARPAADAFLAANAAYRAAVDPGGDWRAVVARLDDVIGRYAGILRGSPGHRDAAFNYEFVVRYRAAVAARQRDLPPAGAGEPAVTIHGIEGTPPPAGGTKQFRMLVPMQPDERREAEEAGRGGRRIRKG